LVILILKAGCDVLIIVGDEHGTDESVGQKGVPIGVEVHETVAIERCKEILKLLVYFCLGRLRVSNDVENVLVIQ
jgi:hypothetical protein